MPSFPYWWTFFSTFSNGTLHKFKFVDLQISFAYCHAFGDTLNFPPLYVFTWNVSTGIFLVKFRHFPPGFILIRRSISPGPISIIHFQSNPCLWVVLKECLKTEVMVFIEKCSIGASCTCKIKNIFQTLSLHILCQVISITETDIW